MKQIKKIPPAIFPKDALTVSVSTASALFNMHDRQFIDQFIKPRYLRFNALHQLNMKDVLRIYEVFRKAKRFQRFIATF